MYFKQGKNTEGNLVLFVILEMNFNLQEESWRPEWDIVFEEAVSQSDMKGHLSPLLHNHTWVKIRQESVDMDSRLCWGPSDCSPAWCPAGSLLAPTPRSPPTLGRGSKLLKKQLSLLHSGGPSMATQSVTGQSNEVHLAGCKVISGVAPGYFLCWTCFCIWIHCFAFINLLD